MNPWIKVFLLAISGGAVGFGTGFPIGALLGSTAVIASAQLLGQKLPKLPLKGKRLIQIFIGGTIGLSISEDTVTMLTKVWEPALLIAFSHILLALCSAFLLHRYLKYDVITAISSTAPAGMSEIMTIAEKYNASITTVAILHLFRVMVIITFIPFIVIHFFN